MKSILLATTTGRLATASDRSSVPVTAEGLDGYFVYHVDGAVRGVPAAPPQVDSGVEIESLVVNGVVVAAAPAHAW